MSKIVSKKRRFGRYKTVSSYNGYKPKYSWRNPNRKKRK